MIFLEKKNKKTKTRSGCWRLPTLPALKRVPSAQEGLTAEFGMGSGMTPPINHQHSGRVSYPSKSRRRRDDVGSRSKEHNAKILWAETTLCCTDFRRATGHISIPRLNALRRVHLEPINLVI